MLSHWNWIALGAAALLVVIQQFCIYSIHRKSKQREELFQILAENAADMIALVDVKGRRIYNSPAYKRVLGYSPAELGETSSFDQIHPDDRFKVLEAAREARETGVGQRLEYRMRHKDGSWRILESIAGGIRNEQGDVTKLVIVNRDVTERKRAEELLEHNSFHDALTGLPNRRLFLDRLQHLFHRAQRSPDRQYALLFGDVDGLKSFNGAMGPALGDQVIVEIGHRLEACLRDEDTISRPQDRVPIQTSVLSRMGGDEFTILLEGMIDASDAMRVGKRILSSIADPFTVEGRDVRTSISLGIAMSTPAHTQPEDLLQEADIAMRRAKALGGSRCEVFDEVMHHRAANQLKFEDELREALQKGQFRLLYQPIVHLSTKQIVGFEALLRWQHPEHGLISPDRFIATIENSGLMVSTGQWVILEACKQLRAWKNEISGMESLTVNANISARQLVDGRFLTDLEATLRTAGIDSAELNLEITESVVDADPKLTADVFSHLRRLRVGITLDDFGIGHSSLLGLRQLSPLALKIDRSLISGIHLDRNDAATVELIIFLAHKLKVKVIAEGIESAIQVNQLRALGCELGQGYLFSQPVEAKAAEKILREAGTGTHFKVAGV